MGYHMLVEYEIREYVEADGSPFATWFNGLDAAAAARVDRYVRRVEQGNFGDSKSVGEGVQELRIQYGPGYRVYYGRDGKTLIILLGGGSKRRQRQDITAAQARWTRYNEQKQQD